MPDIAPLERDVHTPSAARPASRLDLTLGAVIVIFFGVIFVFDIVTPADHVSVCFLYVIPLFLALAGHRQPVWFYAATATILSAVGTFHQPPHGDPMIVTFYANRAIAVITLWGAAALVAARRRTEMLIREDFEEEREKAEHRGRFLDMISHEIGTSLTTIDGQAFRLKKLVGASAGVDIVKRAEKIHHAVSHIKTIVQRIQFASEAGERALRPLFGLVDLRAVIMDAVQQAEAEHAGRNIATDLAGLPERMVGDHYMLKQVMENLLSNAIKYSPADSLIRVAGWAEADRAVLSVTDFGRGIPDQEQGKLFAPYFRARNSRGVHGAGIGLYVCERFVVSHGGEIRIESRLDVGTTVTVRLPIRA
jgi:signal transduction histidine kinase